jgi:hypothetical protein
MELLQFYYSTSRMLVFRPLRLRNRSQNFPGQVPAAAINDLTRAEVVAIIRKQYPKAKGERIESRAKQAVAEADRLVSPRE